jgi:hypothetical protein
MASNRVIESEVVARAYSSNDVVPLGSKKSQVSRRAPAS